MNRTTVALIVAVAVAQYADAVTFYDMMEVGGREYNPIVVALYERDTSAPMILKIGLIFYLWCLAYIAPSRWFIRVVLILAIVAGVLGAWSNL